jgi:hypothetical protein
MLNFVPIGVFSIFHKIFLPYTSKRLYSPCTLKHSKIYWHWKNKLLYSVQHTICNKKLFSAYMKNTQIGKRVSKFCISQLLIEQHEKNFRSSFSALDRFD